MSDTARELVLVREVPTPPAQSEKMRALPQQDREFWAERGLYAHLQALNHPLNYEDSLFTDSKYGFGSEFGDAGVDATGQRVPRASRFLPSSVGNAASADLRSDGDASERRSVASSGAVSGKPSPRSACSSAGKLRNRRKTGLSVCGALLECVREDPDEEKEGLAACPPSANTCGASGAATGGCSFGTPAPGEPGAGSQQAVEPAIPPPAPPALSADALYGRSLRATAAFSRVMNADSTF